MLKHIVMFKLKDFAEGSNRKENAIKIKEMLEKLPEKISEIKYYEIGINIDDSARAADIVLISEFDNETALNNYINHKEHLKAVDFINKLRKETWVVDFVA